MSATVVSEYKPLGDVHIVFGPARNIRSVYDAFALEPALAPAENTDPAAPVTRSRAL